jgi:TolB protein
MVAMWSPVTPHMPGVPPAPNEPTPDEATTTLYLVDPTGNRYAITTFAPGDPAAPELLDWSGDGSHALVGAKYPAPPTVISVDLHTGAQTTIPVNGYPRYTRPDGKALLVSADNNGNVPGTLKRLDLSGNEQQSYPTDQLGGAGQFGGDYLESLDGTQLVLATANLGNDVAPRSDNNLVVLANDGTIIRTLKSPMPKGRCSPVRWWTSTVILAHCTADAGRQLWEMPLDGGAPTALTAVNSGQEDDPGFGGDIDDGVAWQLPSGTFLQSAGACGTIFLSRLTPDMHTTRVNVPGVSDSIAVAGVTGDKLLLLAQVGCGGTTSLLTYDPAANTSTVLLGPPVNGGGVTDALLYRVQK